MKNLDKFFKVLPIVVAIVLAPVKALAGDAVIFQGSNTVRTLADNMSMNNKLSILVGPDDPTSVAKNALKGSLYLRSGASGGNVYVKSDDGSTTSWGSVFGVPYSGATADVNLGSHSLTAYEIDLPDHSTSGTGVIFFSNGLFQFTDGSDPLGIRAEAVYASSFKLFDNTSGEYNTLQVNEGAFSVILPDSITLSDMAAKKIRSVAGAAIEAIHVSNRQLISGAEDIILDWSGGQANMAHGFFGGLSALFEGGGYFNFTNGSISQYASLSAASYDVNDEWGGSVFFNMNPEEGFSLSYSNGTGIHGNAGQVGLYLGSSKVIEATSGTLEIGTGLGLPINLNGSMIVPSGPIVLPDGLATNPSVQYTGLSSNTGLYLPAVDSFGISTNGVGRFIIDSGGHTGLGGGVTPTAYLHLRAGTAATNAAPLKFTSGALNTTAEVGAYEFLTDKWYGTITTGAARKEITLNDIALTSGRVALVTTNGRITDDSDMAFATDTLTVTKLSSTNIGIGTTPGASAVTLMDGAVFSGGTSTGTKLLNSTSQKLGLYGVTPVVQAVATTDLGTVLSDLGARASGTAYTITTSGAIQLNVLTASSPVFTDGSKNLTSTGTVPVINGGTGNTSGTATINANLTGPITSLGNATAIASQTGTGTTFVVSVSPTITGTPTINSDAPIIKAVAPNDGVYLQINNSAGTGRGYFGYGGSSSSTMTIENTEAGLMNFATSGTTRMQIPAATGVVNLNGSTTQNICIGRENGTTPRVAHANVTGSLTTPTFSKQSGDFNTSITRNGAGDYTLAFTGSPFSDTPSCTISSTSGSAVSCGVYSISTSGFSTFCFTSTTGLGSDTGSSITCTGPK